MDFLFNDLSIHGQFYDISSFRNAFANLMEISRVAERFNHDFYFNRMIVNAEPIPNVTMRQAIGKFGKNEQRVAMFRLTRGGSFWDDLRRHEGDDWMENEGGDIVTDSAVGEAAFRTLHGVRTDLVSVRPSDWDYPLVRILWRRNVGGLQDQDIDIQNWRDAIDLESSLRSVPSSVLSWFDLGNVSRKRYQRLVFADNCFEPLEGVPFSKSSADRIIFLLGVLDSLTGAFDDAGIRTSEGNQIYQEYFTGDNALFSDSSDTEKRNFEERLTFPHPDNREEFLFCPWHGKERQNIIRLHFSWPIRAGKPVYVVYAGPKITKK